ncbi:MAG: Stk1 family PASTA domain-containing Ser/Thr kinase [Actinomycetota bacterium]|nr:Stk1 family PASTA domain-containing Ser/Thr kinase [Actinomycetota bacterium]
MADGQRVLADRYELNDKLGAGGMADVHIGRDRVLGRTIAVKTLLNQFSGDPSFIARFRREAQSAAALNHPQIVGVYDTGSDNGTHYIVMEYIEGRTLRDVIREEGPLLPERAAEIAADVCAALSYAHQHGIVHRDVKPANIMMTKTGSVKVTDFGIARAMTGDTVTQTAAVLGTAQYFSPEQAQAAPVDQRSDIYSLGVVLYEMLTRQVPFTGASAVAIAYKHVKEDPVPPSRLNPDVPPALEAITMKALAKNPDNRYQSAQEMRADLQRALQGRPVEATPILMPPIETTGIVSPVSEETVLMSRPVPPPLKEGRRALGIVLLVLLGLAIIGVLLWAVLGGGKKVESVGVPDVIGQKLEAATAALKRVGLEVHTTTAPSDEFDAGIVADQNPKPPAKVEKGSTVTLIVSTGPQLAVVPNLIGKTRQEAETLLAASALTLGQVTQEPSATVKKGSIIRQDPSPDSRVKPDRPVNIVLSSGKQTAIVPDVIGNEKSVAKDRLEARGFKVDPRREDIGPNCAYPAGRVCRQSPEGGKTVDYGSTVAIVIAQDVGQPTESPTANPTSSTPSPTPTPSAQAALAPSERRRMQFP